MSNHFDRVYFIRENGSILGHFQSSLLMSIKNKKHSSERAFVHEFTDLILSIAKFVADQSGEAFATTVHYILFHSYLIIDQKNYFRLF